MAEIIRGEDVVLEILDNGNYFPVLCGTDCTFSREVEFIPITSADSGIFRRFMPRREEWNMSVTGLTKLDNDTSVHFFYLLQSALRRQRHTVRITFTDPDGNSKQIAGDAYIGNQSINGPAADFSNATIEFKGTGLFTVSTTAPPESNVFEVYSDYWNTTNGLNYITGASSGSYTGTTYTLLVTDELLEIRVEGTNYELVSGTPTDGQRECQFTTGPLRVQFPASLVFDGTQRVFVMFKR